MIISDVGGTNGRFAIAHEDNDGNLDHISNVKVYQCRDFKSFDEMLRAFIETLNIPKPRIARLAIAGEMTERYGNLWHFNWNIKAEELEQTFDLNTVTLLNDYEALVYSIPHLKNEDLVTITPFCEHTIEEPYSVFGLGTGFGGAIGLPHQNEICVVPTEIGHISFAPKTKEQIELLNFSQKSMEHVSIENLLSGNGIKHIYQFLLFKNNIAPNDLTPADITLNAIEGSDKISIECIELLFSILASTAGDIAVSQGAKGGIYIGGGIMPKIVSLVKSDQFVELFCAKGPMKEFNQKIPIHVIISDKAALVGCFSSKNS